MDSPHPTDIKAIRPKVYAVLRKAGISIAKSHTTSVRGWHHWTGGVKLHERGSFGDRPAGVELCGYSSTYSGSGKGYVDRAVTALRAAGYTVTDDGKIEALPA